jgi:flagellar L-ring protein precursor FlgH
MIAMTAAGTAHAQSLFRVMGDPAPMQYDESGRPMTPQNEEVRSTSMLYIPPAKPRTFEVHQQVMILVDENSQSTSKESLETKKDMQQDASLKKFPSLKDLIEGELRTGDSSPIVEFGVADKSKYKGEGTYQRDDRFTAKISATIIDVKPNGVLVVEARKSITTNGETKTLVLSGTCRREDVTSSNTVLSSQLADLTIVQETTGELRDASDKGWITRVLEAVFSF